MKKLLVTLAGLSLAATTTLTFAAAMPTKDSTNQQGHPYVGVELGFGGMQMGTTLSGGNSSAEAGGLVYRFSGGYLFQINNQFQIGPELGYMSYTDNTYQAGTTKLVYSGHTIDLLAKAVYNFDSNLNLFAKFGLAMVSQESAATDNPTITKSATLPKLGIGLGYNFTPQIGMSVSFNTTMGGTKHDPFAASNEDKDLTKVSDVSAIMFGMNVSF